MSLERAQLKNKSEDDHMRGIHHRWNRTFYYSFLHNVNSYDCCTMFGCLRIAQYWHKTIKQVDGVQSNLNLISKLSTENPNNVKSDTGSVSMFLGFFTLIMIIMITTMTQGRHLRVHLQLQFSAQASARVGLL